MVLSYCSLFTLCIEVIVVFRSDFFQHCHEFQILLLDFSEYEAVERPLKTKVRLPFGPFPSLVRPK